MLEPGQTVSLVVEKPAVGGSMIARLEGQVVLVSGAIPGERVTARLNAIGKGVAYATTVAVEEASPDRRDPCTDLLCGGSLYAHVSYERQLTIKSQVIADALARIGRIELGEPVPVRPSPERGYRMRARLHVRDGRWGFFREGTHEICDARATQQLSAATADVLERVAAGLGSLGAGTIREMDVSESIDASQRAVHLEAGARFEAASYATLARTDGLTGLTIGRQSSAPGRSTEASGSAILVSGEPFVTDRLTIAGHEVALRRHVRAFFQGNRFLLPSLVSHVVEQVAPGGHVVDLYAGVGVFALALAIAGGARVMAVEGDRVAADDLAANARSSEGRMEAMCLPVELFVARIKQRPDTIVLDPPRTGVSRAALEGVIGLGADRIVYVSCDVATLARDTKRLVEAGYALGRLDAFDLFPNTPHVETVAVFDRSRT